MYPSWRYFPGHLPAPAWVGGVVRSFNDARETIDSEGSTRSSDAVLAEIAPGLEAAGFTVERPGGGVGRIPRPVLFGEQGVARATYAVDAFHDSDGVLFEVEAGRAWMGNAVYRDIVRTSLVVDARFLALAVRQTYRYKAGGRDVASEDYKLTESLLDAIYSSGRLRLPFEGVLLVGY